VPDSAAFLYKQSLYIVTQCTFGGGYPIAHLDIFDTRSKSFVIISFSKKLQYYSSTRCMTAFRKKSLASAANNYATNTNVAFFPQ